MRNRRARPSARNGQAIIRWPTEIRRPSGASASSAVPASILRSALARATGSPDSSAPAVSARYSRDGKGGGHLGAYNPLTGKAVWQYKSKYPLLASVLATAGDLVFSGDPEGMFFALDARTGEKLWSVATGSGHRGSAVSYAVGG